MKVKEITSSGGACPYQCEGVLEDGRIFYLRYRWGKLTLRAAAHEDFLWENDSVVFSKVIGNSLDGCVDNEKVHKELDQIIEFPQGFVFEYDGIDKGPYKSS